MKAFAVITLTAVALGWGGAQTARAEVISGYNGITVDTSQAELSFYPNYDGNEEGLNHLGDARQFLEGYDLTGPVRLAYDDGKVYYAFKWYGREKVLLVKDGGEWTWRPGPKVVYGAPDRCTTATVARKRFKIKNRNIQCARAKKALSAYLTNGRQPRGFKCKKSFGVAHCEDVEVPNDDASAPPISEPVEDAFASKWSRRIYYCGTSDTVNLYLVYASKEGGCDLIDEDQVNRTSTSMDIIHQIVGNSNIPAQDEKYIPSPTGDSSCEGGQRVVYCGEGEDCIVIIDDRWAYMYQGYAEATWKYGSFLYRTEGYEGC